MAVAQKLGLVYTMGRRPVRLRTVLSQLAVQAMRSLGDRPPVTSRSSTGGRSSLPPMVPVTDTKALACVAAVVNGRAGRAKW